MGWITDGKRVDGRKADEAREVQIIAGFLSRADGSAYLEWGVKAKRLLIDAKDFEEAVALKERFLGVRIVKRPGEDEKALVDVPEPLLEEVKFGYEIVGEVLKGNKVVAAVYGPREPIPKHIGDPYRALVRYRYTMAPFSVPERKSPQPGRREIEISKVSREALQYVIFAEQFPMTVIDVFAELLDSNAGTRIAALTAASVALADAGIPMRDLVVGVAAGKVEGTIVVDLCKEEEDAPDAVDLPIAILPRTEEVVLMQMDGRLTKKEWEEAVELAIKKAKEIYEIQKAALKKKYEVIQGE